MKRVIAIISFYVLALLCAMLPLQQTDAPRRRIIFDGEPGDCSVQPNAEAGNRSVRDARIGCADDDVVARFCSRTGAAGQRKQLHRPDSSGARARRRLLRSNIEPRAEALTRQPSDFDPLALTIEEAHREGIKVHAWINIYLVADLESLPTSRDHPIFRHPEWVMVPRGIATELYDVQPGSGAYLDRIIEFSRLNHNELEGLFVSPARTLGSRTTYSTFGWISPGATKSTGCISITCAIRIRNMITAASLLTASDKIEKADPVRASRAPGRVPARPAPIRKEVPGGLRRVPTRAGDRSRVANLQRSQKCQAERDHFGGGLRQRRGRRAFSLPGLEEWLRNGSLDVVCPMAYTPDTADFRKQLVTAMNLASGKRVWSGIGAYKQTAESAVERFGRREIWARRASFCFPTTVRSKFRT